MSAAAARAAVAAMPRTRSMSQALPALLLALPSSAPSSPGDEAQGALATLLPLVGDAAEPWTRDRPDGTAPAGVLGAEPLVEVGEWTLSYRYSRGERDGLRDGESNLTDAEVLATYPAVPQRMLRQVHLFGWTYAASERMTWEAHLPWHVLETEHVMQDGADFDTRSEGVGDLEVHALYELWRDEGQRAHLDLGLGVPIGSIDEKDATPLSDGREAVLPYDMQLGSGTWDLLPGLAYLGQSARWSWGARGSFVVRTGENDRGYSLGDRQRGSLWLARRIGTGASASLRIAGERWGEISGEDEAQDPQLSPDQDPALAGGRRVDVLGGFHLRRGDHRFLLEVGVPLHQDLDGPQLETDLVLHLGWQVSH